MLHADWIKSETLALEFTPSPQPAGEYCESFEIDGERKLHAKSRKMLTESILASVDLFQAKQYFLSDEFSLVDCSIAPILWRLPVYGIDLGSQADPIEQYMKRVVGRRSFQDGLTELEHEMRM